MKCLKYVILCPVYTPPYKNKDNQNIEEIYAASSDNKQAFRHTSKKSSKMSAALPVFVML